MTVTEEYIREQIPTMVGKNHVSGMKLQTLIGLLNGYANQSAQEGDDNKYILHLIKELTKGFNDLMVLKEEHGARRITDQVTISLHYDIVRYILSGLITKQE